MRRLLSLRRASIGRSYRASIGTVHAVGIVVRQLRRYEGTGYAIDVCYGRGRVLTLELRPAPDGTCKVEGCAEQPDPLCTTGYCLDHDLPF